MEEGDGDEDDDEVDDDEEDEDDDDDEEERVGCIRNAFSTLTSVVYSVILRSC